MTNPDPIWMAHFDEFVKLWAFIEVPELDTLKLNLARIEEQYVPRPWGIVRNQEEA